MKKYWVLVYINVKLYWSTLSQQSLTPWMSGWGDALTTGNSPDASTKPEKGNQVKSAARFPSPTPSKC